MQNLDDPAGIRTQYHLVSGHSWNEWDIEALLGKGMNGEWGWSAEWDETALQTQDSKF